MTLSSPLSAPLIDAYLSLNAAFDRFILILLGLGVLYIAGQLLTHFSYEVILRPLRKLATLRNDEAFTQSDILQEVTRELRNLEEESEPQK